MEYTNTLNTTMPSIYTIVKIILTNCDKVISNKSRIKIYWRYGTPSDWWLYRLHTSWLILHSTGFWQWNVTNKASKQRNSNLVRNAEFLRTNRLFIICNIENTFIIAIIFVLFAFFSLINNVSFYNLWMCAFDVCGHIATFL